MTTPINEKYLPNCPKPPQKKQSWKFKLKIDSKILLLLIILLILIIPKGLDVFSNNTNSSPYFSHSIGTYDFDDSGQAIIKTLDHGYAIAGSTWSYGNGKSDMWLVKINSQGNVEWNTTFGGQDIERAFTVVQTSDQGFLVGGESYSSSNGSSNIAIAKFSFQGELLWYKILDNPENEVCYDLIEDGDLNLVLTGFSEIENDKDIVVIKLSSFGDLIWQYKFGGRFDDTGYSLVQTSDSAYVITGQTWSFGDGYSDAILLKVNSNGILIWNNTFGSSNREWATDVINTNDGGFAITGSSWSFGNDYRDMLLVKINNLGEQVWSERLGSDKKESAQSLIQCNDGGFFVVGYSVSPLGTINSDILLYKTSDSGEVEWNKTYGGRDHDIAFSVIKNDNLGFVITGITDASWVYPYYGGGDMVILSVNLDGNISDKNISENSNLIDTSIYAIIVIMILVTMKKLINLFKLTRRPKNE